MSTAKPSRITVEYDNVFGCPPTYPVGTYKEGWLCISFDWNRDTLNKWHGTSVWVRSRHFDSSLYPQADKLPWEVDE